MKRPDREEKEMGVLIRAFYESRRESELRDGSPCPGDEEIAAYLDGKVGGYRRMRLIRHLCGCPSCARAVLAAARAREGERAVPEGLLREAKRIYRAGRGGEKRDGSAGGGSGGRKNPE